MRAWTEWCRASGRTGEHIYSNGTTGVTHLGDTLGFAGLGGERKSLLSGRDVDSLLVREARPLEFVDGSQVSRLRRKARPVLPPLAAARLAHRLDKARGVANHGPEQIWAHIRGGARGHHSSAHRANGGI